MKAGCPGISDFSGRGAWLEVQFEEDVLGTLIVIEWLSWLRFSIWGGGTSRKASYNVCRAGKQIATKSQKPSSNTTCKKNSSNCSRNNDTITQLHDPSSPPKPAQDIFHHPGSRSKNNQPKLMYKYTAHTPHITTPKTIIHNYRKPTR